MSMRLSLSMASLMLGLAQPASAAILNFDAVLNGAQQVPAVTTSGEGKGFVTVDTVAQTIDVSETFSGLTSPTTMAHIHIDPPGLNGPIVLPFVDFPLGVTAGSYSHDFSASDLPMGFSFTDFVTDLQSNDAYFNIHTEAFPGGEIRGNIMSAVPLPASAQLFGAGLIALGAAGYAAKRKRVAPSA